MKRWTIALMALVYIAVAVVTTQTAFAAGGPEIAVARIAQSEYMVNPKAAFWQNATPVVVKMMEQNVATPQNLNPAVKEITVRAVHNGAWVGLLMEWQDQAPSSRLVTDEFGDQASVELPNVYKAGALPSAMMGEQGGRVTILQWRAAFQSDMTNGYPTTKSLYPNAVYDMYPDQVLNPSDAMPYNGAKALNNPVSVHGASPVSEMMAEGFGTLTAKNIQRAIGWGDWSNGMWSVVIAYPMSPIGDSDPTIMAGGETAAAFAIWDGGAKEVGSRKSWADWVTLKLEK